MSIHQLALVVRLQGKVQKTTCLGAERVCGHRPANHIPPHTVVRVPDTKPEKNMSRISINLPLGRLAEGRIFDGLSTGGAGLGVVFPKRAGGLFWKPGITRMPFAIIAGLGLCQLWH